MNSATLIESVEAAAAKKRRSLMLVFCCTVVGAAAQMFIKTGANHLTQPGFMGAMLGMLTNPLLFTGYALYGFNTVLLALALRDSELSLVYPVIALTYVWVTILSIMVLHETLNPLKFAGVAVIVLGVAILGRGKI